MKFVPSGVSRFVSRQKLQISKNSPTLLLGAGIVGVVTTTVLASRATLKAQPVYEAAKLDLDAIQYDLVQRNINDHEARKHRVNVYVQSAAQFTKLYGPTFVVGAVSVACLVGSHKILNDRYSNLAAAYVGLQETINNYRDRVRAEIGVDKEKEVWVGTEEVDQIEMGPNGPKKVKTKVPTAESLYGRFFGPDNKNWKTLPEVNTMWLRQVETYCNQKLRDDGHLFLNRVYEELGLPDSEAGAVCGWLYERGVGDDHVSFGIFDSDDKERIYDFMVGNEGEVFLDFNVAGPIHKMLDLPKVHRR